MLIRKVGQKGKNKLADRWEKHSYIVIEVPNKGVPVYRVQPESEYSPVKTLHRNMLLPFSAIPSSLDLGLFYDSPIINLANLQPLNKNSQNLCKNLNQSLTLLNQKQKNYFTQDTCFLLKGHTDLI